MALLFALGSHKTATAIAFLAVWEAHYLHRSFFYPFTLANPRPTPLSIIAFGACFNLANAAINGYWLFFLADYPASWLSDPRFVVGVALFAVGFVVNRWADLILRKLRAPGESGYKIPRGGPWELVSSPNYLGEIMEWCSWALLTWSLAGLSFAVWTIANLAPRALSNHRWYRQQFQDYPGRRKALVPFVW
jgi:protein-S-isoprenylcysteine O-methyltransferase Ste14